MRYTHLGRTALQVSAICLGTLNLGVRADDEESHAILDTALDRGVNFIDTANQYGWQKHKGYTEEFLGGWFAQGGGRRERVVLGTKVGNPMNDWPNASGLSARNIIASCEESLRRMQTDWIDLFQMHHIDRHAPWDEVWQAMDTLVQQGKVRYVGSSNFAGWHIVEAQEAAARRHFLGIVSEQSVYNLVTRHIELEVIPACLRYGVAVLPWSPLHGGLLSGALRKLSDGSAMKSAQGRAAASLDHHREALIAYEKLCAELGVPPAEVGLAWVMSRPGVTAPVIGPRSVVQLNGALSAMELDLPADALRTLGELFPPVGQGGPGPEAWAW
ncbi:aldo/keto reductase [Streptomyces sp. ISL-112]|uniref:aldo/keto reductase n=1 Tax=unclassified Streptomyces TaxID=2593676 RepID=UPI001BE7CB96|nr:MULTISPECIES: aldo/keto reductase [unclassified Streptomyces]MBT2426321.1 aldo/keto reductase [Streptomyces sp. ISL-112]MBT2465825.1 aldo/keto reductase [Streptomyces sp. ISL-63]